MLGPSAPRALERFEVLSSRDYREVILWPWETSFGPLQNSTEPSPTPRTLCLSPLGGWKQEAQTSVWGEHPHHPHTALATKLPRGRRAACPAPGPDAKHISCQETLSRGSRQPGPPWLPPLGLLCALGRFSASAQGFPIGNSSFFHLPEPSMTWAWLSYSQPWDVVFSCCSLSLSLASKQFHPA